MLFAFFTTLIFIAELIITLTIIGYLFKFDRIINGVDEFLTEAKPKIKSILELMHGISEQIHELTPIWVEKGRQIRNKILLSELEGLMSGILFWSINIKVIRKLRRSRLFRIGMKGLSLIQNMI